MALHEAAEGSVVESAGFFNGETWLEQHFHAMETFSADSDEVSVRENVGLLLVGFRRRFELCVVIHANVAQFLFDIPSNHPICGGSEEVSLLNEVLHQILCRITASRKKDGMMESKTFVDGHCMRNAATRVHHTVRRASRSEQEQDSLGRHVHGGHVERLKHDLRHALSVSLGVHFREQKWMVFRRNHEFVVECAMPDFLHVVPIRDDTVLDQR